MNLLLRERLPEASKPPTTVAGTCGRQVFVGEGASRCGPGRCVQLSGPGVMRRKINLDAPPCVL
ncbi:hypothetical protein E2C01_070497 [Portunus trituberculatus]|uniref:Uncharacterized protein n=1 Tax=Portunus trituberculatus TaxID=210409 RepID=A0A5B7I1G6_PORTR|nr:hypothetical protein [Portunus trituberculatus]